MWLFVQLIQYVVLCDQQRFQSGSVEPSWLGCLGCTIKTESVLVRGELCFEELVSSGGSTFTKWPESSCLYTLLFLAGLRLGT